MKPDVLAQLGAMVVATRSHTCHSSTGQPSCIDWWLLGPNLAARHPAAATWAETGLPSHRPVELRIAGPQRSFTLTALRRPVALPAPGPPLTDETSAQQAAATAVLERSRDDL